MCSLPGLAAQSICRQGPRRKRSCAGEAVSRCAGARGSDAGHGTTKKAEGKTGAAKRCSNAAGRCHELRLRVLVFCAAFMERTDNSPAGGDSAAGCGKTCWSGTLPGIETIAPCGSNRAGPAGYCLTIPATGTRETGKWTCESVCRRVGQVYTCIYQARQNQKFAGNPEGWPITTARGDRIRETMIR